MKNAAIIVLALLLVAAGYFGRAYFEEPTTVEIPVERVVTRTRYVDPKTKIVTETETESTKFDPDAEAKVLIARTKKNSFVSLSYGSQLDRLSAPFYGISYNHRVFGRFFLGASVYTNSTATLNIGMEF